MSNAIDPDIPAPPPGGALHEDLTRDEEVTGPSDRRFGLTIAVVCAVVGAIRLVFGHGGWWWWLGAGLLLALLGLCAPALLAPLNRLWLKLGLVLYKVINPVVMALIFVTTIVPTGILMRLCGKDPLRLKREPGAASYWIPRDPPGPAPDTMRNQF
jgi:hypothetical protein